MADLTEPDVDETLASPAGEEPIDEATEGTAAPPDAASDTTELPAQPVVAETEVVDDGGAATEPGAGAETEATAAADGEGEAVTAPVERRRRARVLLLALLSALAVTLMVFAGWYLILRKPISEFPLPLPATQQMPGYGYAFYGALRPTGIAVTPDGSRIYVTQTVGDTAVIAFDARGNQVATFTPPETGTDHVFVYVAVNPLNGDVYVTDRPSASIYMYGADGTYKGAFAAPASLTHWQPLGVTFDAQGSMFVTDPSVNAVHEFGPDGGLLRTIGQAGQFNFPNSVVEDGSGRLYVADSNNGRIVVLDSSGAQIGVIRRGPNDGDVALPRGMALDDQQRLYVVDSIDQAVKVYQVTAEATSAPTFVGRFGDVGTGDGDFYFPNDVATDSRGRVYVADWNNDRVQVWTY